MAFSEDNPTGFKQTLAKVNETITRSQSAVESAFESVISPKRRHQSFAKLLLEAEEGGEDLNRYEKDRFSEAVRGEYDPPVAPSPQPDSITLLRREKSLLEAQIRDMAVRLKAEEREKNSLGRTVQDLVDRLRELEGAGRGESMGIDGIKTDRVVRGGTKREEELERKVGLLSRRIRELEESANCGISHPFDPYYLKQIADLKATVDRLTRENHHLESLLHANSSESKSLTSSELHPHSRSRVLHSFYDIREIHPATTISSSDFGGSERSRKSIVFEAEVRRNAQKIAILEKKIQQATDLFAGLRLELVKTPEAKEKLSQAYSAAVAMGEKGKGEGEGGKKKGKAKAK